MKKSSLLFSLSLSLLLGLPGPGFAASTPAASKLCLNAKTGRLIVRESCRRGESALTAASLKSLVAVTAIQGDQGVQGIQGEKGDKGDTGAQGPAGLDGAAAAQGAKGDKGDTGDQGPIGLQGPKGDTGETGATGLKGDKGDKGDQGDNAPQAFTLFDSLDNEIGQVISVGCPFSNVTPSVFDLVTVAVNPGGRAHYICASYGGYASYHEVYFETPDYTSTAFVQPAGFPAGEATLARGAVLGHNGNLSITYDIDYTAGIVNTTYNSYLDTAGVCHASTVGPLDLRPLIYVSDALSNFIPPFVMKY